MDYYCPEGEYGILASDLPGGTGNEYHCRTCGAVVLGRRFRGGNQANPSLDIRHRPATLEEATAKSRLDSLLKHGTDASGSNQ